LFLAEYRCFPKTVKLLAMLAILFGIRDDKVAPARGIWRRDGD
jgi:hypothetical protein